MSPNKSFRVGAARENSVPRAPARPGSGVGRGDDRRTGTGGRGPGSPGRQPQQGPLGPARAGAPSQLPGRGRPQNPAGAEGEAPPSFALPRLRVHNPVGLGTKTGLIATSVTQDFTPRFSRSGQLTPFSLQLPHPDQSVSASPLQFSLPSSFQGLVPRGEADTSRPGACESSQAPSSLSLLVAELGTEPCGTGRGGSVPTNCGLLWWRMSAVSATWEEALVRDDMGQLD